MTDDEFLTFLRHLMVLNEDDVLGILAAASDLDLTHARSTLKATVFRIEREQERRS